MWYLKYFFYLFKKKNKKKKKKKKNDDDGGGGGHIVYEPTGDRVMEALRKNITDEYGRGRLAY